MLTLGRISLLQFTPVSTIDSTTILPLIAISWGFTEEKRF